MISDKQKATPYVPDSWFGRQRTPSPVAGGRVEEYAGKGNRRTVGFPVCLQLKYKDETLTCYDFILNISKTCIFIKTEADIEPDARVFMRFYIPPGERILGEFSGLVIEANADSRFYQSWFSVRLVDYAPGELQKFEDFLEGKRHLFDETI